MHSLRYRGWQYWGHWGHESIDPVGKERPRNLKLNKSKIISLNLTLYEFLRPFCEFWLYIVSKDWKPQIESKRIPVVLKVDINTLNFVQHFSNFSKVSLYTLYFCSIRELWMAKDFMKCQKCGHYYSAHFYCSYSDSCLIKPHILPFQYPGPNFLSTGGFLKSSRTGHRRASCCSSVA